jgi:hypothetical protein
MFEEERVKYGYAGNDLRDWTQEERNIIHFLRSTYGIRDDCLNQLAGTQRIKSDLMNAVVQQLIAESGRTDVKFLDTSFWQRWVRNVEVIYLDNWLAPLREAAEVGSYLLCPICTNRGNHWQLLVINFEAGTITRFDSFFAREKPWQQLAICGLVEEWYGVKLVERWM